MSFNLRMCCWTAAVFVALPASVGRAAGADDFVALTYSDGKGQTLPYRLFVPRGYDPYKRYPLVLYLHGAGGRGNDNLKQMTDVPRFLALAEPAVQRKWPCFILAPQCPEGMKWANMAWGEPTGAGKFTSITWPMEAASALLDSLARQYSGIDASRLYVTGISMGGYGTWDAVCRFPGKFKAAVPICGGGDPGKVGQTPELKNLWVRAYHCADDPAVPVLRSREMIAAMKALGGIEPRYTEFPSGGHDAYTRAYSDPALPRWLFDSAEKAGEDARNVVPQWTVFEKTMETTKQYANPFTDVEVDAVFQQGDKRWVVPAFWAGGGGWTVRFAPPAQGKYKYRFQCSDKGNADLNGPEGSLTATAYEGSNPLLEHGFVVARAGRRHFEHADGTPFLWLGDMWWKGLCKRLTWEGFQELTADRRAKGFNVVQIVCGNYPNEGFFEPRWENEGGKPYLTKDYRVLNPAYFDFADCRLKHLVDSGIVPAIVGAWGHGDCDGLRAFGRAAIERHWRYLVARYGALSRGLDPGWRDRHGHEMGPRTVGRCGAVSPPHRPVPSPADLPCRDRPPRRHGRRSAGRLRHGVGQPRGLRRDCQADPGDTDRGRAKTPAMPVLCGETAYEGHMQNHFPDVQRHVFWMYVLGGAAGHTYGAVGVWHAGVDGDPGITPIYDYTTWKEGMNYPGSTQIGLNKKLLQQYPWWRFGPHPEWVDETCFAAGIPGEVRFVYLPKRNPYNWSGIMVKKLDGSTYHAFWFNPVNGKRYDLGTVAAGGDWKSPGVPSPQDWVLVLERARTR